MWVLGPEPDSRWSSPADRDPGGLGVRSRLPAARAHSRLIRTPTYSENPAGAAVQVPHLPIVAVPPAASTRTASVMRIVSEAADIINKRLTQVALA